MNRAFGVILPLFCLLVLFDANSVAEENAPDGFELSTYARGFDAPIALATAPDGRVFVAQKNGNVFVVGEAGAEPVLFVSIGVHDFSESGLLGMALGPDFAENGYVYFFATVSNIEQQILRYTDRDGIGIDKKTIRQGLPTTGQVHNGGGLRVGPDRMLYFSVGDTGRGELSQQINTFAGKICRINLDGSTPSDNPFTTPTGTPRAVFASGFRNPFRFCFASDGRLYAMDVGSDGENRREEINLVRRGGNGGWPLVEGFGEADVESLIQPIVAYRDEGSAIAGCVLYEASSYPDQYRGGLFHLDFVSNKLFFISLDGDSPPDHTEFFQADGGATDLAVGPEGGLLYTEMFAGNVKRLRYLLSTEFQNDLPGEPESENQLSDPQPSVNICGNGIMAALIPIMIAWQPARKRRRGT